MTDQTQTQPTEDEVQLTAYQRLFGVHSNPGQDPEVQMLEEACAGFLDHFVRTVAERGGAPKLIMDRVASDLLSAQMMAVKALTWNNLN